MPDPGISPFLRPPGFFALLPEDATLVDWVTAALLYLDRPSPQVFVPAQLIAIHGVRTVDICAAVNLNVSVQHADPGDAVQVASQGRRIYVYVPPPSSRLSPLGAMVFNLVRTVGVPPSDSVRAARLAGELPPVALESYLTLLSDGTPWERAAELAVLVEGAPSAP